MGKNNLSGAWGEALAAEYLRKKHYKTVAAGYRTRFGEIDLIVSNRKYLVFVEVKLRKSGVFADAREYVDLRKQDKIRIIVRDTGIGISREDLPHVFDRFYKADKSHHGRGTGLGLAIAYEIMKNLGESMAVESEIGEGSAFSFTLHIA